MPHGKFKRRIRKLERRNQREVAVTMDNLDTYVVSLNKGVKPMQLVKLGFVHNESMGVHAIDQSPLGKGAKALRLYVYPDENTCRLHLITLGDKDQQSGDVNDCRRFVAKLRTEQAHAERGDEPPGSESTGE